VWGAVVTDRVRTYRGEPFRLADHIARFRQSCESARVPLAVSDEELTAAAKGVLSRDFAGADLSIVFLATPGQLPGFGLEPVVQTPTLIVHTVPIPTDRLERLYRDGATLVPVPATLGVDPQVKHRSRLPWWVATKRVQDRDEPAEPVFWDPASGTVLETASANVTAVFDGVLTSPPRELVLPGIGLRTTLELATAGGIPVRDRPFAVWDLDAASEVLLTNSTVGLAPVGRIGSTQFPVDGPIYRQLREAWSRMLDTGSGHDRPPTS
jgi:branched-subunit amino acid aminotransferase/4-amino-4-deoxychorismate lyase